MTKYGNRRVLDLEQVLNSILPHYVQMLFNKKHEIDGHLICYDFYCATVAAMF